MHAISSIIVIILILMIVIALTASAYVFFSRILSQTTQAGTTAINTATTNLLVQMKIESMSINSIYVRNVGQSPLTNLSVYVNNVPANFNVTPSVINAGQVGTVNIRDSINSGDNISITSSQGILTSYKAPDPCSQAVGCWHFDEGASTTAYDSSGNGNTATLVNSPAWVAGKYYGNALQFSSGSNQYINMISVSGISPSRGLTASLWVKYTANTNGCPQFIGFNGNNPPGVGWFYIDLGCNSLSPYLDYAGASTPEQDIGYSASLNTWYYLVITYIPSGSLNYYVNGALVGSITPNSNIGSIQNIVLANNGGNAVIDEERVYNKAIY